MQLLHGKYRRRHGVSRHIYGVGEYMYINGADVARRVQGIS